MRNKIINLNGNALIKLAELPINSVHCAITSPPYWGLRDYGTEPLYWPEVRYRIFNSMPEIVIPETTCSLGLEKTPEEFVGHMLLIFRQLYKVLRHDATCWVNMGDSYAGSGKGMNADGTHSGGTKQKTNKGTTEGNLVKCKTSTLKPKDLAGIPWMLAFALRADGWYLRQDIIWHKPNPMPESVTDRCTKSHEYIFLLTKSQKYYYDHVAIKTLVKDETVRRLAQDIENQKGSTRVPGKTNGTMKAVVSGRKGESVSNTYGINGSNFKNHNNLFNANGELIHGSMANKKSVWTVPTRGFKEAHFATFPESLISDCIKAGTSEYGVCSVCGAPYMRNVKKDYIKHENWFGSKQSVRNSRGAAGNSYNELTGIATTGWQPSCTCNASAVPATVIDMFGGSGTTGIVSNKLGRDAIIIELNNNYIKINQKQEIDQLGIFANSTIQ